MVKLQNRIIQFLNKYVWKNMLVCFLCVSSIISLTACCYPSAITRESTDKPSGYSELDYLNSMFSGAMVLTSLTADELTSDYLFYEEGARGSGAKKLNSYFNIADRQFTTMAQYLERMINAVYGNFDSQGNFLCWKWDKSFDIMYPHWWVNDPNCVYSNNIETYYNTALLTDAKSPSTTKQFKIDHTNEYFHYACSQMEGCNFQFNEDEQIRARLRIYDNGKANNGSAYKSNTLDTTGDVQIAMIWIPDEGRHRYYVVSNIKDEYGNPTGNAYTSSDIHFYDVMNANTDALNENQNSDNSHFLWWSWDPSYKRDAHDNQSWTCEEAAWYQYKEDKPNVKNIRWNGSSYSYTYGFQTGNGRVKNLSGKVSDNCDELRYVSWYSTTSTSSKTYYLGKGTSHPAVDLGFIEFGESYNDGYLYANSTDASNGTNAIGKYVQGWYNSYFEVWNQKTVTNKSFKYFEYNNLFFPLDSNINHPYGSIDEVLSGKIKQAPIFNNSNSIPYYKKDSSQSSTEAYLTVKIRYTSDVTAVFDHNTYFQDFAGNTKRKTITAWSNNGSFKVKKIKFALAAINRYGSYDKVKSAYGGNFASCLSNKQYKLNIANSKSIGLSQSFYSGVIDYMKKYIIGAGDQDFFGSIQYSRGDTWLWDKSVTAKEKYLGKSGTTPYVEIFAQNNNKSELSMYKGYDFIIPRIVGSIFSLKNVSGKYPYFDDRITICNKLLAGTFDTDYTEGFIANTLFPTVVASRIYTYGNISTLNRLYNYEMGIDYAPFDVEEDKGKDFDNYEGYQDKIGRYLYLYTDKNAFKNTPDAPAVKIERTLEQFLYGIDKADKKFVHEGTEYYLPTHKGVLDVVTDAKMQSLVLFPKITRDPDTNNPATKPIAEYGDYICVDPTFITSMIGKTESSETYVRMSVEIAGAYTYDDSTNRVKAVTDPSTGEHKVYSYGQSYNHSHANTTIDVKGNFTTSEVTQFLHVKGNEYYTDLAVMQEDKDNNIIRVSKENNIPRYYLDTQVDKYGEYTGSTPLTGTETYAMTGDAAAGTLKPPSNVKFYDNYSREVYIYTEDYLYFKNGFSSTHENGQFSLYKYNGNDASAEKVINDKFFYSGHEDKIWTSPFSNYRVKYDAYKVRSNLFEPLIDGYTLNDDIVGAYIRIDYSYYEDSGLTVSLDDETYKDANNTPTNDTSNGDVALDSADSFDTASGAGTNFTTQFNTSDSQYEGVDLNSVDRDDAKKYGFSLSTKEVDFHLFETGIYAADCGIELMQSQDNTDFPVDMVGDFVVEFVDYTSKEHIFSMGVDSGQPLSSSSAFANYFGTGGRLVNGSWQIGDSYYKASRYKRGSSPFYSISSLKNVVISGDTTIYLELVKVETTLTYDYRNVFSNYYGYLPDATKTKYSNANDRQIKFEYNKGESITPSSNVVDIGEGISISGWKVYHGSETVASQEIDLDTSISMLSDIRIEPIISSSKFKVSFSPNGGKFGNGSTEDLVYYVESGKKASTNASINSMSSFPAVSHPDGYVLKGWSKTGSLSDVVNASNISVVKNENISTEDITYYAMWDYSTISVEFDYISNSSSYYSGYNDKFRTFSSGSAGKSIANYDTSYLSNSLNSAKSEIPYTSMQNYIEYNGVRYKFMGMTPKSQSFSTIASTRQSGKYLVYINTNTISASNYFSTYSVFNSSDNNTINFSSYVSDSTLVLRAVYQKMFKVQFIAESQTYVFYVAAGASLSSSSSFVVSDTSISSLTGDLARWSSVSKDSANYTKNDIEDFNTIKTSAITRDLTYYNIKDNITVRYHGRDGSVIATETYLAGESITSKAVLSGSSGWSTSSTSNNIVTPSDYINNTAGTYDFYAWYSFDVVYHYNGTTYTETVNGSNSPSGYSAANVVGWASSPSSTTKVVMSTYKNSNATVNLYAIYKYNVTFRWHGGSDTKSDECSYNVGSITVSFPPTPSNYSEGGKDYAFDYWEVNGSKVTGSTYTANSNVTIVAKYKDVTPPPAS